MTGGLSQADVDRIVAGLRAGSNVEEFSPGNGDTGASQSLALRVGKSLMLKIRMRHVIPATILSALGFGGYAYRQAYGTPPPVAIEYKVNTLEADVSQVKTDLREMKGDLRDLQLDQIDQWRWQALQSRDAERAAYFARRGRELRERQ